MLSDLKSHLYKTYGEKIDCRIGTAERVEFNRTASNRINAAIAIYIHQEFDVAVIWNLTVRREAGKSVKNLSLSSHWEALLPEKVWINAFYQKSRKENKLYEKVLAVKTEKLQAVLENYSLFSSFNDKDTDFPLDVVHDAPEYQWCPSEIRGKVSTERWLRDARFRTRVLSAYHNKCAICRCSEPKLLEAAHIIAVADAGTDDVSNGICLCANHHIMLDKDMIRIDYRNLHLSYVADSVKDMPWYRVFCNQYDGKLLERRNDDV